MQSVASFDSEHFAEHVYYGITNLEDAELIGRKLELIAHLHDIKARKSYGVRLFYLILSWLFVVLATVWASAATITLPFWISPQYAPLLSKFQLNDTVLSVLIGSTTANVIGLFFVVVRYLFPRRDDDTKAKDRAIKKSASKRQGRDKSKQ